MNTSDNNRQGNRLINETSPYLLQHAHNPVLWYPWGDEALKKAKEENKLLIISIGYSSCHWCHVMERESFENESVAEVMNRYFVSIKVDREERPDIDNIYMNAIHLMGVQGGWPLNIFALPDGRPVWGGTYFKSDQFIEIMKTIEEKYRTEPSEFTKVAESLQSGLHRMSLVSMPDEKKDFNEEMPLNYYESLKKNFDTKNGGNNWHPKFPTPTEYNFLLAYNHHTNDKTALDHTLLTLNKMADGGIYDHLYGGFARYSTDKFWKVPHFEKMLYDNGQLITLYSNAYKISAQPKFKDVVYNTLQFISEEMTSPEGGFYSSFDADSEGVEGKYYIWTKQEIIDILGENSDLFIEYYNVSDEGNWEYGSNILYVTVDLKELSDKYNLDYIEAERLIDKSKKELLSKRKERVAPGLDRKVLTSWNALMLKGCVDAYFAFGESDFLDMAVKNGEFLMKYAIDSDYKMTRNYNMGESRIDAFSDDYSFTIEAFINLYIATLDKKYLDSAKGLADYMVRNFYDKESGMFYFTEGTDETLISRKIDFEDSVLPSSNSVMVGNLNYLGDVLYENEYKELAAGILHSFIANFKLQGNFASNMTYQMLSHVYPHYEVAVCGENTLEVLKEMLKNYHPDLTVAGDKVKSDLPILKDRFVEGKTLIYVCKDKVCQLPHESVGEALNLIDKMRSRMVD